MRENESIRLISFSSRVLEKKKSHRQRDASSRGDFSFVEILGDNRYTPLASYSRLLFTTAAV